jgi:sporulation protein YlmC with PRC-barrel domain
MYNKGLFIRGLLVVSVIGLLCGYALAAQQSGQNEPNKPATSDRTTSPPAAGTTGQTTQPTAGIGGQAAQQSMPLVKSSELIGKKLINTQNEDLGTIHDLVLTPDSKQVSYAALAHGGVFGIGSKLFAIPWNAIKVGADGKPTANISKQTLDQSPGFKDDNWPSQADSRLGGAGTMGAAAGRSSSGQMGATSSTQTGQPSTYGNRAQEPNAATSRDRTRGMAAAPGAESSRMASTAANTDIQNRRVSKLTGM